MPTIGVFDPSMCCSSGACGPSPDPELARFAADVAWLPSHGVEVQRLSLSSDPAAFADDAVVMEALVPWTEEA